MLAFTPLTSFPDTVGAFDVLENDISPSSDFGVGVTAAVALRKLTEVFKEALDLARYLFHIRFILAFCPGVKWSIQESLV